MEYPFAHSTYVDTHRSGIQRSRDWWSDSASGAGEIGNEDRSWSDGRPLQSNEPADVIPAQISVLTVSSCSTRQIHITTKLRHCSELSVCFTTRCFPRSP